MDVNPMAQKIEITNKGHTRKPNLTPTKKRLPENKTARPGPGTQSCEKTKYLPDRKHVTMPNNQNQTMNADQ
jgi:hypothetical protein